MRRRLAAIVFSSCLLGAGAHAAKSSASGADCDGADLAQVDMTACAYQAFQAQDRELNALYGRLVRQEDAASLRQLQAAQRAWLQFRDLECAYETPDAGGSLAPMETASCQAELTKERILDLKRSLRQQVR
jgi:uncharacterized protein YecT (DUF1311 family)